MKKFLINAKVSTKLTIIAVAFIIPILILLQALVSQQNISIDFAQKEIYGDSYLRPLKKMLEFAPALKFANQTEQTSGQISDLTSKIDNQFTQLEGIDKELNEYINTTEKYEVLKSNWNKLKNQQNNLDLHDEFISGIRSLMSYAGDKSNLILDPDLDSYYIMDATLLKLPENMDLLYQILSYGSDIINRGELSADEKTILTVKTGLLHTNMDALYSGVNVAFDNNPAQNLKSSLSNQLEETKAKTNNFLDVINSRLLKGDSIAISSSEYEMLANEALNTNFALWENGITYLDKLLVARIDGFNSSKYFTLGGIILVLILTILLVIFISKRISSSIHLLATGTKNFTEGDSNINVQVDSMDELGLLAKIFNDMISKINESMQLVKSEKENVEKKIETAISDSERKNKYLAESVEIMLAGLNKFADGDLTIKLKVDDDDEIGKLFVGFNNAVDSINDLLYSLKSSINETVSASYLISQSTEEISSGMDEQSSQSAEVTSAVKQMVESIVLTAKNTLSATEKSKKAGSLAKDGGDVVKNTIEGMNKIAEVVKKSADTVLKLGKSSDEIGEIIQVINDIADQTNLLALNAAIEAARAGEQGRGFAVVADEVRKLAERTSKATKEIATMIRQIQTDTHGAVESMKSGTLEVERGIELVNEAGYTLKEIIKGAEEVVYVVGQVATVTEEQSSAAEQIDNNMQSINNVINENTSGLQQIARSAKDLTSLTNNLEKLIAHFKIELHGEKSYKLN
ncbi:MAG: methyl-accepting chemotaxis protein [bacterium]